MALGHSPQIVTNGLIFYVDPSNSRSYSGFGNTIYNMVNSSIGGTFVGYTSNPIDNTFTRSIIFDGVNDFLNIPSSNLQFGTSDFTIQFWFKVPTILNDGKTIFSDGWGLTNGGFLFYTYKVGSDERFLYYSTSTNGTWDIASERVILQSPKYNTWYNVAVSRIGNNFTLYLDGRAVNTFSSTLSLRNTGYPYTFGADSSGARACNALLGLLAIYKNKGLTATEILQNYNATKKKFNPDENIITDGLILNIDPAKSNSYPGTGNTIYDLSVSGINGTLINSPSFSALNGGQINMPGSSKYIDLGQNFNFTSENFSISQWIYLDSFDTINNAGQGPIPFFKGDFQHMGYYSQILSDGSMVLFTNQGGATQFSVTSAGILTTSAWYNLSCVRNGSSIRIYVNGIDKTSTVGTHINPSGSNQTFKINYYKSDYLISGQMRISQFLIYNRALSAQEILQNYNATKNRFVNALPPVRNNLILELDATSVSSYPGTGTSWYDTSGFSNNANFINGPTFSSTGTSSSIAFDGTNDYVDMNYPRQINTGSPITLALWAKWITTGSTTATIQTLVDNNYQTAYIDGPGSIGFFIQDRPDLGGILEWGAKPGIGITRCTSTFVVGDGKWHYITATNDGANSILYIDGAQSGLARTAAGIGDSQPFINLGRWRFTQTRYLNGNIADFRIYNRALSAYEVKQNFDYYRARYGV